YISREACEESIQQKVVLYDRDGDYHYDIISAFIKSLRGRDPDAAMYWLARMVAAGEDPHFIFRRMLISACEDTGLADPQGITVVESAAAAFDRVGLPEGRYFLSHAALFLATAPKSNSSMAFFDALSAVRKEDTEVPNHLKDPSRDGEGFGHGQGYQYPHAYRDHWVAQQYLPASLMGRVFYTPSGQGYEKLIRDDVLSRRELQIAALLEQEEAPDGGPAAGEHLTFSPSDRAKEGVIDRGEDQWRRRLTSDRAEALQHIRSAMLKAAGLLRHHRVFVWNADDGLLVWQVLRSCPEGVVCALCRSEQGKQTLEQYGASLDMLDKPRLAVYDSALGGAASFLAALENDFYPQGIAFDRLFFRNIFSDQEGMARFRGALETAESRGFLAPGWKCVVAKAGGEISVEVSALG
ncbi:MAG: recombinase RarA, partial [Spirochaetaceae bacterium]|nr:recombinase RarA [Spirochaetaceae bacterium]